MRVCGVICEYNPFHNGHAAHLAHAREKSGADYVVCAMSGAFTQRGLQARHDKRLRARMALENGADLVLELPVRFACAPAPEFARGGVRLLAGLGVVTHLSFGVEPEAMDALPEAAKVLREEPEAFREVLRRGLNAGRAYPRALSDALARAGVQLPEAPNAVLALAYLRELPREMQAVMIPREGGGYHEDALCATASATAVRAALSRGELDAACAQTPCPRLLKEAELKGQYVRENALDTALLWALRTASLGELRGISGMDEGLEYRFAQAARDAGSRTALLEQVKTKRYTHARLSRICANVLLGITREFARAHDAPTYARVLGFRRESAPLLRAIAQNGTLPLVTKVADYAARGDALFALDLKAQDIWTLGVQNESERGAGRDFVTSPVML